MAKFKVGSKAMLKDSGEYVRVLGYTKDGLVTVSHLDGRLFGDFAEGSLVANALFDKNDINLAETAEKAARHAFDTGDKARVAQILKELETRSDMSSKIVAKKIKDRYMNSCTINSTRPIVQMALNRTVCNWGSLKNGTRVEIDGRKGTVIANPGGLTRYTIKFDDGKTEDSNSLAPYFKVINSSAPAGVAKNIDSLKASIGHRVRTYDGKSGVITDKPSAASDWMWTVKLDDGKYVKYHGKGLNSAPAGVVGNAPYNPQVAIDSWNNNVVPAVSKLFGEIRKIVTVLEHNKNEDLTAIQRADNDAMLKRAKAGLEKVKELMNVR